MILLEFLPVILQFPTDWLLLQLLKRTTWPFQILSLVRSVSEITSSGLKFHPPSPIFHITPCQCRTWIYVSEKFTEATHWELSQIPTPNPSASLLLSHQLLLLLQWRKWTHLPSRWFPPVLWVPSILSSCKPPCMGDSLFLLDLQPLPLCGCSVSVFTML